MGRRTVSLVLVFLAFIIFFAASLVHAEGDPAFTMGLERFAWLEYDDLGGRLLKETGPRFRFGFSYDNPFADVMVFSPRAELMVGIVDYDGALMNGEPVQSETRYFGVKLEGDVGMRSGPFIGLGFQGWDRMLRDSTSVLGNAAYGYTEEWFLAYGRIGIQVLPVEEESGPYVVVGAKLPIMSENTALWSQKFIGAVDLTFEPKMRASAFAEAGFKSGGLRVTAYYEALQFDASDPVLDPVTLRYYYQPRSESDMVGVRMGLLF